MDYLKVFVDFADIIEPLADDEKGRLFTAMLAYAADSGYKPDLPGNERFVWAIAKQNIDRTAERVADLARRGSLGGKQKQANSSKAKQDVAECSKSKQDIATSSLKDNDNDNDKENINNNKATRRFTPPTIEDVKAYIKDQGYTVDAEKWFDFYASKGWMVGSNHMKDWKAAVRTWTKRDDRATVTTGKVLNAQAYGQRQYTDEQISKAANRAWLEALAEEG